MSLYWTPLSFFVRWGFIQPCISGKWLVMLAIHHFGYHIPRGSGPRQSALFVWPIAAFRKSNASKMHLATHFVAAGIISQGRRCSSASWPQIQAAPVPRLCGRASGRRTEGTLQIKLKQFSLSLWRKSPSGLQLLLYILTEKERIFLRWYKNNDTYNYEFKLFYIHSHAALCVMHTSKVCSERAVSAKRSFTA